MFLIILGILLFAIASRLPQTILRGQDSTGLKRGMRIGGVALLILGFLSSAVRQIDAGNVGVQSLFGKIQSTALLRNQIGRAHV